MATDAREASLRRRVLQAYLPPRAVQGRRRSRRRHRALRRGGAPGVEQVHAVGVHVALRGRSGRVARDARQRAGRRRRARQVRGW